MPWAIRGGQGTISCFFPLTNHAALKRHYFTKTFGLREIYGLTSLNQKRPETSGPLSGEGYAHGG